jgi:hypothetical protein
MPGLAALADWQEFRRRMRPFLSASLVVTKATVATDGCELAGALVGIIGTDGFRRRKPLIATSASARCYVAQILRLAIDRVRLSAASGLANS